MTKLTGIAGDLLDKIEASGYTVSNNETVQGGARKEYRNQAELVFYRSELLYDIQNLAYVEGDVMPTEDEHDRHQVQDIAEDGNVDRVNRIIGLAIDHCREMLYPYSRTDIDPEENRDDVLQVPLKYVIKLKLPDDFSKSTLDYLTKLIHEYLVYRVLTDWLSITDLKNPTAAANWSVKLQQMEDEVTSTLNARIHRVRLTQSPF